MNKKLVFGALAGVGLAALSIVGLVKKNKKDEECVDECDCVDVEEEVDDSEVEETEE